MGKIIRMKWFVNYSSNIFNSKWKTQSDSDCCISFLCRMKYLWTPYVCMFTAFGVCSPELWMTVFKWLKLKSVHPVILVSEL